MAKRQGGRRPHGRVHGNDRAEAERAALARNVCPDCGGHITWHLTRVEALHLTEEQQHTLSRQGYVRLDRPAAGKREA